jgi:hypothetical protein
MPGQGPRPVLFVATEHNSVYAFDAETNSGPNGGLFWQRNLGPSAATPTKDFGSRFGAYGNIIPEVGITSTPVIDLASGTIYVDAFTHEGSSYLHRIHSLNITNGVKLPGSPVLVSASVPGLGVGSTNGVLAFNPRQHLQRPALTLAGGVVYAAFSSYADTDPYHGWVIGFDAATLQPLTNFVFNTTPNSAPAAFGPNAGEGGIWMSGAGLTVDTEANLFLEVGNGSFNANQPGGTEYGDCFLKLFTTNGLTVADYFAPFNQAALAEADTDLGSSGALLLPDSEGSVAHPRLLVGCGKEGRIYLLDRDHLGGFHPGADNQIVQELPGAVGPTLSSAAWFNHRIYYQGMGDVLKAFRISNGLLSTEAVSHSRNKFALGATPTVSANGTNNGIVWLLDTDGYVANQAAVLHAYNADDLTDELYNSGQAGPRDTLARAVKFTLPIVADGRVYVGTQSAVAVFGLRGSTQAGLSATSTGTGQVMLQWTGSGTLEEALTIVGPWEAAPNQNTPQMLSAVGVKFYRLRQ